MSFLQRTDHVRKKNIVASHTLRSAPHLTVLPHRGGTPPTPVIVPEPLFLGSSDLQGGTGLLAQPPFRFDGTGVGVPGSKTTGHLRWARSPRVSRILISIWSAKPFVISQTLHGSAIGLPYIDPPKPTPIIWQLHGLFGI